MPIITPTQDGNTVNAMAQTTELQKEIDKKLTSQLQEMEVARTKAQYQQRQDQVGGIMIIYNITIKHQWNSQM